MQRARSGFGIGVAVAHQAGGLLHGLITQHRFVIEPSGLIFSVIGAIIVTALWTWFKKGRASH